MDRRTFLEQSTAIVGGLLGLSPSNLEAFVTDPLLRQDFGSTFKWGVATAAYQIEGAWDKDGKGPSIWDHMCHTKPGKIKNKHNGDNACDFYHSYKKDIELVKAMNFDVFRFSIAWTRILPTGKGAVNQKGIDFYNQVIDHCLSVGVEPWITIYHWDLPQALEEKGGWANRDIIDWFCNYTDIITNAFGDRVKNWMVLNEPMAFTAVGYLMGMHAPGYISPRKFLQAAHHATMVQSMAAKVIRKNILDANIGTTFSCSHVQPKNHRHKKAAYRGDILLNRLFIEPALGLGYPTKDFQFIKGIETFIQDGDMEKCVFDFDFIGLQNYTRYVFQKALIPFVWMNEVKPKNRNISTGDITEMGWEVYPEGIYHILKQFASYKNCPPIIITENGAAFEDTIQENSVHDSQRVNFYQNYLAQVRRAMKEGVDVRGYFCWSMLDNFEWAEGYGPRFGIVHVDYETQKRTIKDSGKWFQSFLAD